MSKSKGQEAKAIESPLSKEQLNILQSREQFFQSFIQPELVNFFEESRDFRLEGEFQAPNAVLLAAQQAGTQADAFAAQRGQLQQSLARRGLEGSGVEGGSLALLGAAEAQARGQTVNQAQLQAIFASNQALSQQQQATLQEQGVRAGGLGALLSQAPRPTTAAPTSFQQATQGSGGAGAILGGAAGGFLGGFAGPLGSAAGTKLGGSLFG